MENLEGKLSVFETLKKVGVVIAPFLVGLIVYSCAREYGAPDPAVISAIIAAPVFDYSRLVMNNNYRFF